MLANGIRASLIMQLYFVGFAVLSSGKFGMAEAGRFNWILQNLFSN
jgi:hypothetical protein